MPLYDPENPSMGFSPASLALFLQSHAGKPTAQGWGPSSDQLHQHLTLTLEKSLLREQLFMSPSFPLRQLLG